MSSVINEHNLFKPKASKAEAKADVTDRTARGIIDAESQKREVKTARLRQARLEMEAAQAAAEAPVKPRRAKAAAPRRGGSSM